MNKDRKNNGTNLLLITLVSLIVVFAMAVIITTPSMQVYFQSKSLERIIQSERFTNIYLFMLGAEIPQFKSSLGEELKIPSLSNLAIEIITGFKTDNASTLLLNEIPGLTQLIQKFKLQGLDPITLIFHKSHPHQILMRYLNKKVPTKMKHQIHWLKTMIKMKMR